MITHASAQQPSRAPSQVHEICGKEGDAVDHDRNPSSKGLSGQARFIWRQLEGLQDPCVSCGRSEVSIMTCFPGIGSRMVLAGCLIQLGGELCSPNLDHCGSQHGYGILTNAHPT